MEQMPPKPEDLDREQREAFEEVLGKITILRHGNTEYTEEYPDLTPEGIERVSMRGKELRGKIDTKREDMLFLASPAVRAQGSLDNLKKTLGLSEEESRISRAIRSVDIRDRKKALEVVEEVMRGTKHVPLMDRAYATDTRFEDDGDVWQPRSEVEKRFFRSMEYVIRVFDKYQENGDNGRIPHVVAVSHFEFLNHFVAKVFDIDLHEGELIGFAEAIEIVFLKPQNEDESKVSLLVSFRGESKQVVFDRDTRSIVMPDNK